LPRVGAVINFEFQEAYKDFDIPEGDNDDLVGYLLSKFKALRRYFAVCIQFQ
jgi:hypothetical protein